jgi:iron-sulfur cluster assembly protein
MNTFTPVQVTAAAHQEIIDTLTANKIPENYGLRVGMKGGGCAGQLLLGFDLPTENDQIYLVNNVRLLIDKRHLMYVINTEIDFEETKNGAGFTINKLTDLLEDV